MPLSEQLKVLDQEVKSTQVKLNQLVSGGNQVIPVSAEAPTYVQVVSMNTTLIRIETKDHRGPL